MADRIPEEIISDVRHAVDILDIVSEVVRLKKAGRNHIGLCPFHSEKTPSFTVNTDKQIFHCFGCGQGGDAFGFIMKMDGLSFPEAIRALAQRAGIRIPDRSAGDHQLHRKSDRERLYGVYQAALTFYEERLEKDGEGAIATKYLKGRQIDAEHMSAFRLGYAPAGWTNLLSFLKKRFPLKILEMSGLIVIRDGGAKTYDRFRNRIMFPIFDVQSRVIGFGGRAIDDATPKYLNSPETLTYNKRRSLYGIHLARAHCRKTGTVMIVEGYFDCIALHQHGLKNTVATLGTALTGEQIRILKGHAEKMVLIYDSDEAGIKAAVRSVGMFIEHNISAKVLVLPDGQDPDSCIRRVGAENFIQMTRAAKDIAGFLIDTAVDKHGTAPEGKVRIVNEMMEPLAAIADPVARTLYVKELSERIGVEESAVLQKLSEFQNGSGRGNRPAVRGNEPTGASRIGGRKGSRMEHRIISMLLQFPQVACDIAEQGVLEKFEDGVLKRLGMIILACIKNDELSISDVLQKVQEDDTKRMVTKLSMENEMWDRDGCLALIRQFAHSAQKETDKKLVYDIKNAESENNEDLLYRLLTEKQKHALDKRRRQEAMGKNHRV